MLPSESQLRYLNKIIKGVPPPEICDTNKIHDECSEMQQTEEMSEQDIGNSTEWTNKIYHCAQENAKMSNEGITINACFNPNAAAIIKTRLMPYVAIWSGIMQTFFNINTEVATSTYVEAEFAEIKNRVFKGQLPMKADKFVYEHLEYINGRIKLVSCPKDIESAHVENIIHDISAASSIQTDADRSIECSIETIETSKEEDMSNREVVNVQEQDYNTSENWRGLVRKSPEEISFQCCVDLF